LCSNASSAALSEGVLQGFCSLLLHVGQEVGIDVQGDADRGRPEISSGIQAVRLGTVGLAMSDIYGGNAMQLTFFLLADLLAGTPVLPTASAQSLWLGALGALVTTCYIFGLLARREKKVLGLGPDSLVVLFTYIGGVLLLTAVPG
jgi:cation:H+ antiporter